MSIKMNETNIKYVNVGTQSIKLINVGGQSVWNNFSDRYTNGFISKYVSDITTETMPTGYNSQFREYGRTSCWMEMECDGVGFLSSYSATAKARLCMWSGQKFEIELSCSDDGFSAPQITIKINADLKRSGQFTNVITKSTSHSTESGHLVSCNVRLTVASSTNYGDTNDDFRIEYEMDLSDGTGRYNRFQGFVDENESSKSKFTSKENYIANSYPYVDYCLPSHSGKVNNVWLVVGGYKI